MKRSVITSTGKPSREAMDAWVRQNLATPIKVRTHWAQYAAIIALVIMFVVPAAVVLVFQTTWAFTGSRYYSDGYFAGGLIVMLVMGGVCYLLLHLERKAPKTFDISGVILKNGRLFRWDEFIGVNYSYIDGRLGVVVLFVAFLLFDDGKVSIAPRGLKEGWKIIALIESLPGERTMEDM